MANRSEQAVNWDLLITTALVVLLLADTVTSEIYRRRQKRLQEEVTQLRQQCVQLLERVNRSRL